MLSHRSVSIALRPPVVCHNSIRHAPNFLARQQTKGLATTTAPSDLGSTMPPNYVARVGQLKTFTLPEKATGSPGDVEMGKALINAWREDGILQIAMNPKQQDLFNKAFAASKRFFALPPNVKANCVDTQSYAGYIASGEEITDGIADYSEIFTVTKDLPLEEPRVAAKWPCHGPCPWPDIDTKAPIQEYMDSLGSSGETLLQLIEHGLSLEPKTLTSLTKDGWHHLRTLRFPQHNKTNGKGKDGRGIGSHTDYGLLVIAGQDEVGGLFIRPPYSDEKLENWKSSAAGFREHDDRWTYVPPVPGVFTVGLNTRERYAFAYFHEPSFQAEISPIAKLYDGKPPDEKIHYGTHFTNMFMRNYPDRVTTERILKEDRLKLLDLPELRTQ
ncbi:hypothetical protein N7519_002128 [Penicillium mononematosum]|uniref:uncharacterized protein n=1 Tax=Penicillium mononematosum TaxID=268346 RepID=UPI0025470166|nr:uncharacterized protein N7519_002128 [Penicillium mononematosum]KAJ6187220.1 hypothetical protein N7519_002128 [Penicillium mononematosum]